LTYETFYDVVRCYTTYYFVVVSVITISSDSDNEDGDDDDDTNGDEIGVVFSADSTGIAYPLYIIKLCM